MRILALDVGERRTGVAFIDSTAAVPLALQTIEHASTSELFEAVQSLITDRIIDHIILGLPYLPSGEEGAQAKYVRSIGDHLEEIAPLTYVDERYSSHNPHGIDHNAAAACKLAEIGLKKVITDIDK